MEQFGVTSEPKELLANPDYVIAIVSGAQNKSCSDTSVSLQENKSKKNSNLALREFKIKAAAIILAGASFVSLFGYKLKEARNKNIIDDYLTSVSMPLYNSIHLGEKNPNTQSPYWWYEMDEAINGFKNSNTDTDIIIYSCYKKLYPYNFEEHLNELISSLTEYNSFEDYLKARGIESKKQYEDIMDRFTLPYAKQALENEQLEENPTGSRKA